MQIVQRHFLCVHYTYQSRICRFVSREIFQRYLVQTPAVFLQASFYFEHLKVSYISPTGVKCVLHGLPKMTARSHLAYSRVSARYLPLDAVPAVCAARAMHETFTLLGRDVTHPSRQNGRGLATGR